MTLDLSSIKAGLLGHATLLVAEEHTAPKIGSGHVPVLATPVLINLMEAAALDAAENLIPAGHQSLGTELSMRHVAATLIGMRVRVEARLVAIEGRTLTFRIEAHDERELIGDADHQRVIVNVARFDARLQTKAAPR